MLGRLTVLVLLSLVPLAEGGHGVSVRTTHADWAHRLLELGQRPLFVDLRPAEEFRISRLPGARSLPISDVPGRYGEIPRETLVVLYCACRGEDLEQAYDVFRNHGYRNVSVMPGGFPEWTKRGFPIER